MFLIYDVTNVEILNCRTFINQVIAGYLPGLILVLFLLLVPPTMLLFSSAEGYISRSQIERSACNKLLFFIVWNILLANILSGSALYQANLFLEPKSIPKVLAEAAPAQVRLHLPCDVSFQNIKRAGYDLCAYSFLCVGIFLHCIRCVIWVD